MPAKPEDATTPKGTKPGGAKPTADGAGPKLLSGGNPQIPKGDGDAPVQAYLDALPEWKHGVGEQLDRLIVSTVPGVRKAIRWNSPFYGSPDQPGWFISFHCLTSYIKVSFFQGSSLDPLPPFDAKDPNVRYLHIFEDGAIDEPQFVAWVRSAARLPGWGVS